MTNKAKLIFADYTSRFIKPGRQRLTEMWQIRAVEDFLESGYPVTKKGIKQYMATLPLNSKPTPAEKEAELLTLLRTRKKEEVEKKRKLPKMETQQHDENVDIVKRFAKWLLEVKEYSPNTIRSYIWTATDYFKQYPTLTQKNAVDYKQWLLAEGKSRATVNMRQHALSALGIYLGVKITLKTLKVPRAMECNNVPSEKDMKIFLAKCKEINHFWYLVARCLSTTGLRVHELRLITYADMLAGGTVLIGKGGKPRRIFFQKEFIKEIKAWLEVKSFAPEDKFCTKTTRGIAMQIHLYAAKAKLDVTKFHPHAFRHYFAKQYLKNNPTDIVGLQNLLGHSSIETTSIYLQRSYQEQLADYHKNVTWQ